MAYTVDDMIDKIDDFWGKGKFTYIEGFTGVKKSCRFRCEQCGNSNYIISPQTLTDRKRKKDNPCCNMCKNVSVVDFNKKLKDRWKNNEFELLANYKNLTTHATFRCNSCGNSNYRLRPIDILRKRKVASCNLCGNSRCSDTVDKEMEEYLVKKGFSKIGNYKNLQTPVEYMHAHCGKISKISPSRVKILKNHCQFCRMSKGELNFSKYLDSLNITYEVEKTVDEIKNKSILHFDFYIESMNLLIEIDGAQHSLPSGSWMDSHFSTIEVDRVKERLVLDSEYCLVRFPVNDSTGRVFGIVDFFECGYICNEVSIFNKHLIKNLRLTN